VSLRAHRLPDLAPARRVPIGSYGAAPPADDVRRRLSVAMSQHASTSTASAAASFAPRKKRSPITRSARTAHWTMFNRGGRNRKPNKMIATRTAATRYIARNTATRAAIPRILAAASRPTATPYASPSSRDADRQLCADLRTWHRMRLRPFGEPPSTAFATHRL
jgi:hypothetical protein